MSKIKIEQLSKSFELKVNSNTTEYKKTDNGITFYAEGGGDKPLEWEINQL